MCTQVPAASLLTEFASWMRWASRQALSRIQTQDPREYKPALRVAEPGGHCPVSALIMKRKACTATAYTL